MRYFIFRHAETYFSKHDYHYGEHYKDAEILTEGIPVIEKLAEYLKDKISDDNYTSPFKRAIQTVEIIERITEKKFISDERLGEEGLTRASETFEQLVKRLKSFTDEIENKNTENVSICSHGWPLNVLKALLTKGSVSKHDLGGYPECGQLLVIENKKIKILDFN